MASIRIAMALVLALALWPTASVSAQVIGPICVKTNLESVQFELFAFPMGSTSRRSQFLLSAVSGGGEYTGAASLEGQTVTKFTLITAHPAQIGAGVVVVFSGAVDLQTNTGEGTCSTIGAQPGEGVCGTASAITYTVVNCNP
jgi:hypothetical protein